MKRLKSEETIAQQESAELSLRDYWDTVQRYRVTFILVVAVVLLTSTSMFVFKPKKFTASAKLFSTNPDSNASTLERMMGRAYTYSTDPKTISRIAQSQNILDLTLKNSIEEFNLLNLEAEEIKPEELFIYQNLTKERILGSMSVNADSESADIINIKVTLNECPNLCIAIANGLSKAILEALTENNRKGFKQEVENLEISIRENELEINSLNDQIKKILSQKSDFKLSLDENRLSSRLGILENQLSDAELRKKEIDDQIKMIKVDFGIEDIAFEKIRWIDLSSTMHQKLQNLKFEKEELLTRYHPENPSVKKIENQIQSMEETLKPAPNGEKVTYIEVDRFKTGIVTRLFQLIAESSASEKRYQYIKNELKLTQAEILASSEEQKQINELRNKMKIFEEIQIKLHTNLQTTKMSLLSTTSNFEIFERAKDSTLDSGGVTKHIAIGLAIGVALAFCVVILLKNWENTLKSSMDLKSHFHYPSLGGMPNWKFDQMYINEMEPDSQIAEVYGMLRNHIRFSSQNKPEKSLLICSAFQGEGKSVTAANLALSFALEGNQVLLVSADLRRPESLTKFLKDPQENGIVEYLEEEVDLKDVIYPSIANNLSIVPTVHQAKNPTRLLKNPRFKKLLDYGEEIFDVLIIDSPAILPVVDTTMFAHLTRGVLVLAQADQTPINSINEMLGRLEHVNAPIIGICLNKIMDLRLEYSYSYGSKQPYEYFSS